MEVWAVANVTMKPVGHVIRTSLIFSLDRLAAVSVYGLEIVERQNRVCCDWLRCVRRSRQAQPGAIPWSVLNGTSSCVSRDVTAPRRHRFAIWLASLPATSPTSCRRFLPIHAFTAQNTGFPGRSGVRLKFTLVRINPIAAETSAFVRRPSGRDRPEDYDARSSGTAIHFSFSGAQVYAALK